MTQLQQQQQHQHQQQLQPEIADTETYYTTEGQKLKIARKDPQTIHIEQQNASPAYAAQYASPALSSADGSPITNLNAVDVVGAPQVIVYKTSTASASTGSTGSPISRRAVMNVPGAGSSVAPTTVAYSSVIQSTLQQQPLQVQQHCWTKPDDEEVKGVLQLHVKQEHRQLDYANNAGGGADTSENLVFNLPPGLEIKQTFYQPSLVDVESSASLSLQQAQAVAQEHLLQQQQQQDATPPQGRRQHVVANMIVSPGTSSNLASQIQTVPKVCIYYMYLFFIIFYLFVFCLFVLLFASILFYAFGSVLL